MFALSNITKFIVLSIFLYSGIILIIKRRSRHKVRSVFSAHAGFITGVLGGDKYI